MVEYIINEACRRGENRMSHSIAVPDEIYEKVAALAQQTGQSVDALIAEALEHLIGERQAAQAAPLDWTTASAETIIADLRASRVERERDITL